MNMAPAVSTLVGKMIDKTILIIDDDPDLLNLASHIFQREGAQTVTAHEGMEGINKLFAHHPNLVILDIMMPQVNGFEICRRIRLVSNTPIIMLTALNNEREMLEGLDAGADDFLSKPFHADVLLARARAVLRRSEHQNDKSSSFRYNDGYLSIDIEKHSVLIKGRRVKLTRMEFHLLVYLARNAGKVLTYNQILSNVWGDEYRGSLEYVHIYISHLRRKLEENARNPNYILTVHGIGYIFENPKVAYHA